MWDRGTLSCILVKAEGSTNIGEDEDDAWIKDYTHKKEVKQHEAQSFEWVRDDSNCVIGWEACFTVPDGYESTVHTVEIHSYCNIIYYDADDIISGGKQDGVTSTGMKDTDNSNPLESVLETTFTCSSESKGGNMDGGGNTKGTAAKAVETLTSSAPQ
jgi:hypothetical protein